MPYGGLHLTGLPGFYRVTTFPGTDFPGDFIATTDCKFTIQSLGYIIPLGR
jgi:hypothetical protein